MRKNMLWMLTAILVFCGQAMLTSCSDDEETIVLYPNTSVSLDCVKPNYLKAGDKVAFTDAILKLYHDRELCKEMGANGRKFVMENLTKEVGTQKYVDVIKSFEKK